MKGLIPILLFLLIQLNIYPQEIERDKFFYRFKPDSNFYKDYRLFSLPFKDLQNSPDDIRYYIRKYIPDKNIDYKILEFLPDSTVDYKILESIPDRYYLKRKSNDKTDKLFRKYDLEKE